MHVINVLGSICLCVCVLVCLRVVVAAAGLGTVALHRGCAEREKKKYLGHRSWKQREGSVRGAVQCSSFVHVGLFLCEELRKQTP